MAKVSFQGQSVYELVSGASRVLIAPKYGARLLKWVIGEQEIIHWPENSDWANGYSVAHTRGGNPILFPFIARHYADGVLGEWRDAEGIVRELPMHGFARDMPFKVVEASDGVLRMRLKPTTATRAMYPFKFTFDVIYELKDNALQATFETTNNSDAPLPYYAGHHFYFSIPHGERKDWEIILPCGRSGVQNKDGSVEFLPMLKTQFALNDAALIDRFHLDFSELRVLLKHQKSAREIAIELLIGQPGENSAPWYDVTTWTQDETSDFFCVEPWLGLPNAIHSGLGLRWIQSRQTETATCRIIAS